jgi:hypothetical protein
MEKKNLETPKEKKEVLKKTETNLKLSPVVRDDIPTEKSVKEGRHLTRYIIFVASGLLLIFSLTIVLFLYYKNNLSSEAILRKTLLNLSSNKNFKYNGTVKLTFSSRDVQKNLDLNEIEIYSLVKRSNSDNHEISIQGEVNRGSDVPEGNFNLSWSISNQKMFGFVGKFTGYEILYKAESYPYSGLISEKSADEYSVLNLKDLFTKIYFDQDQSDLPNINLDSFKYKIVEVLPDDLTDGQKAYHYKIRITPKDDVGSIFSNIALDDWDIWIEKRSQEVVRIEGVSAVNNVGMEGNSMNIQFDLKLNWE